MVLPKKMLFCMFKNISRILCVETLQELSMLFFRIFAESGAIKAVQICQTVFLRNSF